MGGGINVYDIINLYDTKSYYIATRIKTALVEGQIYRCYKIENSEIEQCKYAQMILTKVQTPFSGGKIAFQQMMLDIQRPKKCASTCLTLHKSKFKIDHRF